MTKRIYYPLVKWKSKVRNSDWWYEARIPIRCVTKREAIALANFEIQTHKNIHPELEGVLIWKADVQVSHEVTFRG